jgi:hypothetical protein
MKASPKANLSLETEEIEITPEMIEAGVLAYYENSGEGWSNPGDSELSAMVRNVFQEMWSIHRRTAASGETISCPPA